MYSTDCLPSLKVVFSLISFGDSFLFSLALVSSDANSQTGGSEVRHATKPFRLREVSGLRDARASLAK
jgi:hypothetical protein